MILLVLGTVTVQSVFVHSSFVEVVAAKKEEKRKWGIFCIVWYHAGDHSLTRKRKKREKI
jgi:hypothetical protein